MYALVTGASSGIGREIARQLAQRKYDLIIVARRVDELNDLKLELANAFGVNVVVKPFDLSNRDNCVKLHWECLEYDPKIIVNNAGFGRVGAFADHDLAGDLGMIDTNVTAVHILTKLFVQSMGEGRILNVASMAGFLPTPLLASYAATKAYVHHLGTAIDYELRKAKKPIRVLTLCPGPVHTEFGTVAGAEAALPGMSAKRCATIAVRGLFRNRRVILPGFTMHLTRFFLRFLPLSAILSTAYSIQKKK
ncbi:MAG TPA: ketoacyl reductase [Acholeplasmatales bacterium]|nr:ketoacyl reductase [Acholeplasmatales bacterium]